MGTAVTPWARRGAWVGLTALLALGIAVIVLPEAGRLVSACAALAGWSLAHWGCPQPVEASPVVTCGLSRGLLPAP